MRGKALPSIDLWFVIGLAVIAGLFAGRAAAAPAEPWGGVRERVLAAARPAYHRWLDSLAPERAPAFGFRSLAEARGASLLPPIPFYVPDRRGGALTRARIEALVESPSSTWLVPVAVEGRVVALVTLETRAGREPEVTEFGKAWAANRLEAGLERLEKQGKRRGEELRFVAFFSPTMDVLLARRRGDRRWSWLELSGTTSGKAEVLDAAAIETRLARIRETDLQEGP
jgi:hypothetical protein